MPSVKKTDSQSILRWTERAPLSSRIIDPLGIYFLKRSESLFLPGITTQTERLRYFSLLTWAWKTVDERNLSPSKVLDIEKIAALAAALHHLDDSAPPNGIRNRESAKKFLQQSTGLIRISDYTSFGRDNKIGYGNLYYRGPLVTLHICAKDESGKYVFSEVGERIADLFKQAIGEKANALLKEEISKRDLVDLRALCFCVEEIPASEQEIWRLVFFGFTKLSGRLGLKINLDELDHFERGEIRFPEISLDVKLTLEDYLKDMDRLELGFSNNLPEMIKRTMARQAVLFLIVKIIDDAKPKVDGEPIDQIIRDCLYFRQFADGHMIREIDFGRLNDFAKLWESYVHNLYYINFLELFFEILLDFLKHHPNGASIDEMTKSFNITKIARHLLTRVENLSGQATDVQVIDNCARKTLGGKRTSLKTTINEKLVALNARNSQSVEEKMGDLLLLFLLIRYRFESFSHEQRKDCDFDEKLLFSVVPSRTYSNLANGNIHDFINSTLKLVKNRHRLISSRKFALNGTKSWLFTEEDQRLYHYGTDYSISFYREAKWGNVINLLIDMGLIDTQQGRYCLTELGKIWLKRIS